jgi:hypothetical protein
MKQGMRGKTVGEGQNDRDTRKLPEFPTASLSKASRLALKML